MTTITEKPELLDIHGAQLMLSVGRTTIYNLIADGSIPAVRIGRRVLFRRDDIEAYVRGLGRAAS